MGRLVQTRVQCRIDSHTNEVPAVVSRLILNSQWPRAYIQQTLNDGQGQRRGENSLSKQRLVSLHGHGSVSTTSPWRALDDDGDDCPEEKGAGLLDGPGCHGGIEDGEMFVKVRDEAMIC